MMESQSNTTHVEYAKLLPSYWEPPRLRELGKVPFELGRKQKGWA